MTKTKKPILSYFSGIPRPVQRDTLLELEKHWENYDVFVINAPVGSGKSRIAMCVADWQWSVDIITPTNMLVDQYVSEFPDFPKMLKKSLYSCCKRAKYRKHRDCERLKDNRRAFSMRRGVMNYYMYMSLLTRRRKTAPILIVDEAHNLIPTMQSLMAEKMWKHQYYYPENLRNYKELERWAEEKLAATGGTDPRLQLVVDQCKTDKPTYVFQREQEWWMRTKPPEMRDVLNIKPVEVARGPSYYWGSHIDKLILMSSTINRKDIESMGLEKKRVLYLETQSAIPAANRPVIFDPVTPVIYSRQEEAADLIGARIKEHYLPNNPEKGVIHCTYEMAMRLRTTLHKERRLMWHTADNKSKVFEEFRRSPPQEGRVLVASGLYEGIDLPGDAARWQIIAKVPWISLADRAVEYKAKSDVEWYVWQTLKDLIQATGRVCRGPSDYGATYIVDSTFKRLYNKHIELIPEWFVEAVQLNSEAGEGL